MKNTASTALGVLFLGSLLGAQTYQVHPGVQATLEGNGSILYPVCFRAAKYKQLHYLQVDDLRPTNDVRIRGIAFRPDGSRIRPWASFQAELELRLCTARRRSSMVNRWFDANQTKDLTTVIARKAVKFPAFNGVKRFPAPFLFDLPFDGGKSFLLRKGKEVCWDIRLFRSTLSPTAGEIYLDGVYRGTGLFRRTLFEGTIHPKWKARVSLQLNEHFYQGRNWLWAYIDAFLPKGTAFLFFGTRTLPKGIPFGSWGGVFHLDPAALAGVLGPFRDPRGLGSFLFSFPIPSSPNPPMLGLSFYTQAVVLGSLPGEACSTNLLECCFVPSWRSALPRTGHVVLGGLDALVSPTGEAHPDQGVVVRYRF